MTKRCRRCNCRIARHNYSGLCSPCSSRYLCQICRDAEVGDDGRVHCEECRQVIKVMDNLRRSYHFPRPPAAELEALVRKYTDRAARGLDLFTEGAA